MCVKVASLRPAYDDLKSWLDNEKHTLVCRGGRVFIKKRVFHYRASEFANPYKVKHHGLDQALRLYEAHLNALLEDPACRRRFLALADYEQLGCFCDPNAQCHRDVIIAKLKQLLVYFRSRFDFRSFALAGYLDDKTISTHSTCIRASHVDTLYIKDCTIDGCVSWQCSQAIALLHTNATLNDVFITDVVSGGTADCVFALDTAADLINVPQVGVRHHMSHDDMVRFLRHEPEHLTDATLCMVASHLKGVVPTEIDTLDALIAEHKWREFRTLERLVCHNSHLVSKTYAMYAKWVERLCQSMGVNARVVGAFSNLYKSGNVPLPLHRDAYDKWIVGLSFGETRTLEFVAANNSVVASFELGHGDVLMFPPRMNDHFQHRMLAEPQRTGARVNLTFFLDVSAEESKLLQPVTKVPSL